MWVRRYFSTFDLPESLAKLKRLRVLPTLEVRHLQTDFDQLNY
jgi:hypothetical protein